MSLVIPPGFAQAALRWSLAGDPEVMISTVGLGVIGTGQEESDALADDWITEFPAGSYSSSWTFLGVRMSVGQDGGPPAIVESPRSVTGTASVATPPNNFAVLFTKQTAVGGRQGRGRMFLPPFNVDETHVDARGMLEDAYLASIGPAVNTLMLARTPVLLHDSTSPGDHAPTIVTAFIIQRQGATQRRRMRP